MRENLSPDIRSAKTKYTVYPTEITLTQINRLYYRDSYLQSTLIFISCVYLQTFVRK